MLLEAGDIEKGIEREINIVGSNSSSFVKCFIYLLKTVHTFIDVYTYTYINFIQY